jgi:hypothetical protein
MGLLYLYVTMMHGQQNIKLTQVVLRLFEYDDPFLTSERFSAPPPILIVLLGYIDCKKIHVDRTLTISEPLSVNSVFSPSVAVYNYIIYFIFRAL